MTEGIFEVDAYGMDRQGRASAHPTRWGAGVWTWDTVAWLVWDSAPQTWPTRAAALKAAQAKARQLAKTYAEPPMLAAA